MNKTEFQKLLSETPHPIIAIFWAPWCASCRMAKPTLERVARDFSGKVNLVSINVDESPELLGEFRVMGVPTVLAFQNSELVGRLSGAKTEAIYRTVFEALVEGKEVKAEMAPIDRLFRLVTGTLLVVFGLSSNLWWLTAGGALIAFMGIHDRCPVWKAITARFQRQ